MTRLTGPSGCHIPFQHTPKHWLQILMIGLSILVPLTRSRQLHAAVNSCKYTSWQAAGWIITRG